MIKRVYISLLLASRKLYVCISIVICLLVCCLVLFFLFPRSVTLTPVSLLSAMVFFTDKTVEMEITVSTSPYSFSFFLTGQYLKSAVHGVFAAG